MPLIITPRPVAEPEIAYDKTLISLAISPIVMEGDIEAAMSMRCVPYRVLSDGSIDKNEELAVTINSGAVFAESAQDPALAAAAQAIWEALQTYLSVKGI